MRKICVVTGTRADYGLLRWVMEGIRNSDKLELQIITTGMHLSPEFGLTYREIEQDGFLIDRKVEMLLSSDTPCSIAISTGLGMISFANALSELKPDFLMVLGDRFEIFAATFSALVAQIPVVHISGGETTLGAFDEAIRHSVTKMSWLHFVAADEYAKRVIQLGENPNRVIKVGGLGVEAIKKTSLLSKKELEKKTGIRFAEKNILVTYHPVTLEKHTSKKNFQNLIDVLCELKNIYIIFTMPNADPDGRIIMQMIDEFVLKQSERSIAFTSMGHIKYLSTLKYVDGVVGNSSSGLAEAPSFKIGTINIGDRQKGRLKADSVIDCSPTKGAIISAFKKFYSIDFRSKLPMVENPYGGGDVSDKIKEVLENTFLPKDFKKEFNDL